MVADGTRNLVAFMGPNGDTDVTGVQVGRFWYPSLLLIGMSLLC